MSDEENYLKHNKELWNLKTEYHLSSEFYDVKNFIQGKTSLNEIELNLLGNICNKSILHLQCHFGQDSISLARCGAKVVGVDFSDVAIKNAKLLAEKTQTEIEFICCDLYSLPNHLDKQFDLVFTSYGTIGWLPDIKKWANIVSRFLKPAGKLVFVDFHPFIWMYNATFEKIVYNYFNTEAIVEIELGTYADKTAPIKHKSVGWNHPISETLTNLIDSGLIIKSFNEFNYSPYNCFNDMIEIEPKKFQISKFGDKAPLVYSIVAVKK